VQHIKPTSTFLLWLVLVGLVFLLVVGVLILLNFDPVQYSRFFPQCSFKKLTGFHCPGCGLTRAAHALVHGDILRALSMNVFFIGGAPLFALMVLNHFKRLPKFLVPFTNAISKPVPWLVLLMSFWIARNIPYYPFTLLAPG
jgi:Protein of unknown function (DUF2752)